MHMSDPPEVFSGPAPENGTVRLLVTRRKTNAVIFGFDSAWTDSFTAPGALCSVTSDACGELRFHAPELTSFAQAQDQILRTRTAFDFSFVAIDQPTVVPNLTGSRPVDRIAASVISYIGGGVQPANRGKIGMFCDRSPIWPFIGSLGAAQDPEAAAEQSSGHFLAEVFPALALPALLARFGERNGGAKYNPERRKTYQPGDWKDVCGAVADTGGSLAISGILEWARMMAALPQPRKADQDRLDAAICALIGVIWCCAPRSASMIIGDVASGYIVTPVSVATRERLLAAEAGKRMAPPSKAKPVPARQVASAPCLRDELVNVALNWQRRFGAAPALSATLAEYDAAVTIFGMSEEAYARARFQHADEHAGPGFIYDGTRYYVTANKHEGTGDQVKIFAGLENGGWDALIWISYDRAYWIEEARLWTKDDLSDRLRDTRSITEAHVRQSRRIWPREVSSVPVQSHLP